MKVKAITAIHKEEEVKPRSSTQELCDGYQRLGFNQAMMEVYDYLKANPGADFLDVITNVKFKPV